MFALIALGVFDSRLSGMLGLSAAVTAAPGLLIAGAPLGTPATYPWAILASVPLWLIVGFVAARRATRRPISGWREYWSEYLWLAGGIAVGANAALLFATTILGESVF
jgi:hypothetical protein